ncbi:MAG: Tim44/TimA family putative adaptor protein [Alphaproteobacteria bacterium]|nr:Tim44/TimA family putative adaptor protein [Alphaproteobacteria bacterium]
MELDLLLFAAIAAFLVFRLRSVLGRRIGHERPPVEPDSTRSGPRPEPTADNANDENVVSLPDRQPADAFIEQADGALGENLRKIRDADPSFNSESFVEGGRAAFEMIVTSFALGDRETLRPLLSDEVYENFAGAIVERADKGHTMEMTLVGIQTSEIIEASMDGRVAFVATKFVTEQVEVTRDSSGDVIEGDPTKVSTVTDIWTFARNTRSRNPNWTLVATEAPN